MHAKPTVVVSECLGYSACRFNGQKIPDALLPRLEPFCDLRPICPEVEIGLGVPRDPVRLVQIGSDVRLLQPATGRDVTAAMQRFSEKYLAELGDVDGFVLKGRSPSCGVFDAKLYPQGESSPSVGRRAGLFAEQVLERFPEAAVEDEGRLNNFRIREHFLTRLFTRARFRHLERRPSARGLVRFHSDHKLLLMAYNQTKMRELGRLVANLEKRAISKTITAYRQQLVAALSRMPRYTANINVLMHGMGYFKKGLGAKEKAHFLDLLEGYREGKLPLSAPLAVLRSWIHRFDEEYLSSQTFFEPYPVELVEITDSGKGRGKLER